MSDKWTIEDINNGIREEAVPGAGPSAELPPSAVAALEEAKDGVSTGINDDVQRVIIEHGLSREDLERIGAALGNATLADPRLQKAREDISVAAFESIGLPPTPTPTPGDTPTPSKGGGRRFSM